MRGRVRRLALATGAGWGDNRRMRDLWKRLEAWKAKNVPDMLFRPRPPTTEEAIADAETEMKLTFPADFRASLLVHDGEEDYDGNPNRFEWMPGCDRLAPL